MRNFTKILLLMGISLLLLTGCSSTKEEKNIDNFINELISTKTYENITSSDDPEKFVDESKEIFKDYLTEDAFDTLMANRIPYIYYTVINKNGITDTTDIKIVKTKESENDTYKNYEFIHYEYEVSYKLKLDDKSIDMTDYMVFKVMKDNTSIIDEVSIFKEKSSIFIEYLNSKNYQIN